MRNIYTLLNKDSATKIYKILTDPYYQRMQIEEICKLVVSLNLNLDDDEYEALNITPAEIKWACELDEVDFEKEYLKSV